jgi:hypothetical protein
MYIYIYNDYVDFMYFIGYMAFHHMLLYLAKHDDSFRQRSNEVVKNFLENPTARHKQTGTPDLGRYFHRDVYEMCDHIYYYGHDGLSSCYVDAGF